MHELVFKRQSELPAFILDKYCKNELLSDGAAALMASLEPELFKKTVLELKHQGKRIAFGTLSKGIFTPYASDVLAA